MKLISLIGITITGNRGAEAMLLTTIGRIREKFPDYKFAVYSYYPKIDRAVLNKTGIFLHSSTPSYLSLVLFPLSILMGIAKAFKLKMLYPLFPKSIQHLAASKILIDLAGVSFMDGRKIFLPFDVLTIFPAMLMQVPVVKFSQAMGPFNQFINKLCVNLFLKRCKKIFARGERTFKYLQQAYFENEKINMSADIVFLHKIGDTLTKENQDYADSIRNKLKEFKNNRAIIIGICPSSFLASKARKEDWDYPHFLCLIIRKFVAHNYKILLFPNATRDNKMDRLRNNDLPVIANIIRKFKVEEEALLESVVHIDRNINTDSIKQLIELTDITVVSRFHAMIASLTTKTPVLVLGWSHKYLEVMRQFSIEEWSCNYTDLNVEYVFNKINALLINKNEARSVIEAKLPDVQQSSYKQLEYIFQIL